MCNVACALTMLRIILTPFIVALMVQGAWTLALLLFLCAVATDLLDGFVARKFKQQSKFGQILDPIADKILISSVLYAMVMLKGGFKILIWFLICKDLILLLGGGILWFGYKKFIPPSRLSRAVALCEVLLAIFMFMMGFVATNRMVALIALGLYVIWMPLFFILVALNVLLSVWLLLRYAKMVWYKQIKK